jgi:hypothetical protein
MSVPITLNNVTNLANTTTAQTTINNNNAAITTAFTEALNVTGDTLLGNLNANNNQIINLPPPASPSSPARLQDVTTAPLLSSVPPTGTSGAVVPFLNGTNTWSSPQTISTGAGTDLTLVGTNNNALEITNSSATFPNKIIRVASNGDFQVTNSANSINILDITDAGNATFVGTLTNTGALSTGAITSSAGPLALASGTNITGPANLQGTNTNNNASVGFVGEYVTSGYVSGVSIGSTVTTNVTSISLTAGDWEVSGMIGATPANTTLLSGLLGAISLTTASLTPVETGNSISVIPIPAIAFNGTAIIQYALPHMRVSLSTTTTIYLNVNISFSTSTCTAQGILRARRVR